MDTGTEIRDAVKIVIQQMREHPEDFEHRGARFGWIQHVDTASLGLNEAETRAFNTALAEMRYRKFNDSVLNAMLEVKEGEDTLKYKTSERYAFGWTDPAISNGGTGNQYQNQYQNAQQQLMKQQGSSLKPSDALNKAIGQLKELVTPKSSLPK